MSTRTNERDEQVAAVLAAYFAEVEAGRGIDWRDLVKHRPELARELSEFFGQREDLGRLLDSELGRNETGGFATTGTQAEMHAPHAAEIAVTDDKTARAAADGAPGREDTFEGDGEFALGATRVRYFGDYELRRVLGRGGMGIVYGAQQIRAGLWADREEVRRFQNEAAAVANLDHPGIVPVYEWASTKGGITSR